MRIIAGKFKGTTLYRSKDKKIRPLKDMVRENIFNFLTHSNKISFQFERANILDLYSGTGSFGLECVSRGALSVTFFENYKKVLPILKKNIFNIDLFKISKIVDHNIFDQKAFDNLKKKFDIIFLDPPYKEKKISQLLEKIIELNLLKKDGIFIIHRHKKEKDILPKKFKILKEKSYGISKIIFGKN